MGQQAASAAATPATTATTATTATLQVSPEGSSPPNGNGTGQATDAAVEVTGLFKAFQRHGSGSVEAVDGVDLRVRRGDVMVLLGPSGSGKTTLLRCIAGLERPTAGRIVIDGRVVFSSDDGINVPTERRAVGMMFQSYALWPHMTVAENIAYPLRVMRMARPAVDQRVAEVLDLVQCSRIGNEFPSQISGGQQQRVALARAIVSGSDVVLFDEPLSNVDAKVRDELRERMLTTYKELGLTAIYVTHDQSEAVAIGDQIAVVDSGKIAQVGPPEQVYDQPDNLYVAGFLGRLNQFDGVVRGERAGAWVVETPIGVVLARRRNEQFTAGDHVITAWRPERTLVGRSEPSSANRWAGQRVQHHYMRWYSEESFLVGEDAQLRSITLERGDARGKESDVWLSVESQYVWAFTKP